jgi:hypothetical protein
MGFGHRVYKNYDPRAKLMQETCNEVLTALGLENDPLFKLALAAGLAGAPARCMVKLAQERFRAEGEVGKSARLDMAVTAGGLTIGVGFALAGAGAAAPLLGLGLAPLAALPFVLPGELKQARGGAFEAGRVREYALYGYPIAASLAILSRSSSSSGLCSIASSTSALVSPRTT